MTSGKPVTVALAGVILAMLGLTVFPAGQQQEAGSAVRSTLSSLDFIEIQQLARKYAWAMDGGDNYGYALADLFTPDGIFTGASQPGADSRTYKGRDELATAARGGSRGATQQSHFTMNHLIKPNSTGATGRVYVVMIDVGVVGKPNRINHGGYYDDVYERTPVGWRFKQRTFRESKVDVWPASAPGPVR